MKEFLKQKRNITVLIVWGALVLALIGGLIANTVAYRGGNMTKAVFDHRLLFFFSCLGMMTLVYLVELIFRIRLPLYLELACTCFSFMGLAGGTVFGLYGVFPQYDKVLHTTSGVLFSIMGMSLASLLLKNQPLGARRVVAAVAIALFFSLTVGYLWELYEFSLDTVIGSMNNQRWQSGMYPVDMGDGTYLVPNRRGTALIDTMGDMIVNFFGTLALLIPVLIVCFKKPDRLSLFEIQVTQRKKSLPPENNAPEAKE